MIDDWSDETCLNVLTCTPFSHKKNNNNLTYDVFLLILIFCFKHAVRRLIGSYFVLFSCRYTGKREDSGPGDKVNSIYSLAVFNFTLSRLPELQNPKRDEFRDLYRRRLKLWLIFGIHRHKHISTPVFKEDPS